jgi:hypothetical protein
LTIHENDRQRHSVAEKLGWRERAPFVGVLLAVQLGLIVFYLSGTWPRLGMPFDDSWIHLSFVRNLAEHGVLGFNDGEWSGGTTSLLWDVLVVPFYLLSGGQMLAAAYLVGVVCYLMAGVALYLLLESAFVRTAWGRGLALAGAAGFVTIGLVPYLALSGMETLLFLALALWSLVAYVRGRYGWAGGLLAALSVTRIEALGLVFLLALATFVASIRSGRQGRWRAWTIFQVTGPAVLSFFFYLMLNWRVTGRLMPTTLAGRKWLWGLPDGWLLFSPERARFYLRDWGRLVAHFCFADAGWVPLVVVTGLSTVGLGDALRRARSLRPGDLGPVLLVIWVLVHNLAYLFLLPAASARYQAPNLVALPALAAMGAYALVLAFQVRYRPWAAVLAGLAIVGSVLPGGIAYRQVYADNVDHIDRVHVAAGRWVAAQLSPDALVAAFDVGAVRYFGRRRTLDLGGLMDARFTSEYLIPGRVGDYLYEQGATHLVMPEPAREGQTDLGKRLGLDSSALSVRMRFRPLVAFQVPPYVRPPYDVLPYHFYTAYRRIVVYEIEYTDR